MYLSKELEECDMKLDDDQLSLYPDFSLSFNSTETSTSTFDNYESEGE